MQRRKPLARESAKRKAERSRRREVVEIVKQRDGDRCKAVGLIPDHRCWGPLDPDEIVGRGRRPGGHLDPENVQLLCRRAHEWKHANPAEAKRLGLSRSAWD